MNRRMFLGYGAALATVSQGASAQTPARTIELSIEPTDVELIDGRVVFMWLYYGQDRTTPRPVLRAREGEVLTVRVRNNAPEPHGFAIPGIAGSEIPAIAPGAVGVATFAAPVGGTYLYVDPLQAPAHRLVGLHGVFVSEPANSVTARGALTPFSRSRLTPAVEAVFDALGPDDARFPGDPWFPAREKIWMFTQIDPTLCALAAQRQPLDGARVRQTFAPRYFTINGLSGFDASEDSATKPKGYVGQPLLLRTVNAGMATHAPHIHGNHVLELSGTDASGRQTIATNVIERDTWILRGLQRKDVLLPFEPPQDIPAAAWPPRDEPFPMRYAMHCHIEMSQTAGGGNYPQGLTTHWELLGPARPVQQG